MLSIRIVQDLVLKGFDIDLWTLTRTKHEKRGQQDDRGLDRKYNDNVAPEILRGHDCRNEP